MTSSACPFGPRVVSMNALSSRPDGICNWHTHPFDEFCMVADDSTTIGHGGVRYPAQPNTLFLFRRGERHGFWNSSKQKPKLWVLHFAADANAYRGVSALEHRDPRKRLWKLSDEQAGAYKGLFLKILGEHVMPRDGAPVAESAWLRLLLIAARRWGVRGSTDTLVPETPDRELAGLWHVISHCADHPDEWARRIHEPSLNYDSLRHRFRKTFGCSPREMLLNLRTQQAKNLLLETTLSIKEISERLGYPRQHEFARAFRKQAGVAPTAWRKSPCEPLPW